MRRVFELLPRHRPNRSDRNDTGCRTRGSATNGNRGPGEATGFASLSGIYPVTLQGFAYCGRSSSACGWLCNDEQVHAIQLRLVTKTLAHTTFNAVSDDCLGRYTTRDCQPEARMSKMVRAGNHAEQAIADTPPTATNFAQFGAGSDTPTLRKSESWWKRQAQALRRARPLARRALNTLRPPGVLIRARKPWLRLRLITLGWNVLFIGLP